MKTIKDAVWQIMTNPAGVCGKIELENGMEISCAMNQATYGSNVGLWEICVFRKNDWQSVKMNCLSGCDVEGWLSFSDMEKKIEEIQKEMEAEHE